MSQAGREDEPEMAMLPSELGWRPMLSLLPGWNSLDSVSATAHGFQLVAIVFFALALIIELLLLFIEDRPIHRRLELVGIVLFFLCAGAEFVAYKYDVRREILELSANAPRRLSDAQKASIQQLLLGQPTGSVSIFADLAALDARDYAGDFATILRNAGWKVNILSGEIFPEGDAPPPRGVHVIIKEHYPPIPIATAVLVNALRKGGIDFVFQYNEAMADEIQIQIDPK